MTDMARLRAGRVGGQFWSVFIPPIPGRQGDPRNASSRSTSSSAWSRLIRSDLEQAYSADDIVRIHKAGKVASLIGIEGGHQMGHSFAALRQFYDLGARYMTLTHFKTNDWADCATDDPKHDGLTDYGRASSMR